MTAEDFEKLIDHEADEFLAWLDSVSNLLEMSMKDALAEAFFAGYEKRIREEQEIQK